MKILSDEDILEAFDGEFGEVHFDHKPTPDDIFLLKLKLVARKAEQERDKEWMEWGNEVCGNTEHTFNTLKKRYCNDCWQELEKQVNNARSQ